MFLSACDSTVYVKAIGKPSAHIDNFSGVCCFVPAVFIGSIGFLRFRTRDRFTAVGSLCDQAGSNAAIKAE